MPNPAIPEKAVKLVAKRRHPLLHSYNLRARAHAIQEVRDDLDAALPSLQEAIAERLLGDESLSGIYHALGMKGWQVPDDEAEAAADLRDALKEAMRPPRVRVGNG